MPDAIADMWTGNITLVTPETPMAGYLEPMGFGGVTGWNLVSGYEATGEVLPPVATPLPAVAPAPTISRQDFINNVQPVNPLVAAFGGNPYLSNSAQAGIPTAAALSLPVGLGADLLGPIGTAIQPLLQTGQLGKVISTIAGFVGKNKVLAVLAGLAAAGIISYAVYNALKKKKTKARRRYSIGTNPRLGTLIKVSKRCDKITRKFTQRARHAGILHLPARHSYAHANYRRHH